MKHLLAATGVLAAFLAAACSGSGGISGGGYADGSGAGVKLDGSGAGGESDGSGAGGKSDGSGAGALPDASMQQVPDAGADGVANDRGRAKDTLGVEDTTVDRPFVADADGDTGAGATGDAAATCALSSALTFGYDGGMAFYRDQFALAASGQLTVARTYYGATDGPAERSCSPALPACGASGAVSLSTIAQDLAAADVQAAFALTTSQVYGVDNRPVDGVVWSVTRASGGNVLVGNPCSSPASSSCRPIPAGIQRLADDLKSLATAATASPACQAAL